MHIATVALDTNGNSYFCETSVALEAIDFSPPSPGGYAVSGLIDCASVRLLSTPAGYVDDWHPVPYRMLVFLLSGEICLETSDADRQTFKPGDIFICEDTAPPGHRIHAVDDNSYRIAVVQLSEGGADVKPYLADSQTTADKRQ